MASRTSPRSSTASPPSARRERGRGDGDDSITTKLQTSARPGYASKSPPGLQIPLPSSSNKAKPLPLRPSSGDLSRVPQRPASLSTSPSRRVTPLAQHQKGASLDSPLKTKFEYGEPDETDRRSLAGSFDLQPRDLDRFPHDGTTPVPLQTATFELEPPVTPFDVYDSPSSDYGEEDPLSLRPRYDRSNTSFHTAHGSFSEDYRGVNNEIVAGPTGTSLSSEEKPSNMNMGLNVDTHITKINDIEVRPKSPNNLASFFGWKTKSPVVDSPSTTFSDGRSVSPMPSPLSVNGDTEPLTHPHFHPVRRSSLKHRRDKTGSSSHASEGEHRPRLASPLGMRMPDDVARVEELLGELREVSGELAHSIRREMDLEDEMEKYKSEMPPVPSELSRRTSDYFSDSGASSMRAPIGDSETKIESLEKMRRKAEQEKAQLRIDMAEKLQEDLNQRRALEMHIKSLEEQLSTHNFQSEESTERERQLSASVDDFKRRLQEERSYKGNFEDLLAGMREELEAHRMERDNLRDEVVPQLKARVEGLENEAAKFQTLQYENTKMSQELQSLKNENQTLVNARRLQLELQQHNPRFKPISEEEDSPNASPRASLSRSGSIARKAATRGRSNSAANKDPESLPERLKDMEEQRDALHRTLKALVLRQDQLVRQHAKQMRVVEIERDDALSATPRRAAFAIEVQGLRSEVNHLRQRANDALEQKWQCEKGLGGIKMDLDRAQQETASLRTLLQRQDMFLTDRHPEDDSSGQESDSLDVALSDLTAIQQAGLPSDRPRVEALAMQVKSQLSLNKQIRNRMADAIARGEKEQQANARKLTNLEVALRNAEDLLTAAQNVSEEAITRHEDHVRSVKEAQTEQTLRGVSSPLLTATPNSRPTPSSPFGPRSPRLDMTRAGKAMNVQEAVKTPLLQSRVRELEEAASKVDREMEQVVEAMNKAQIEVAELQTQRDEAIRETRRLQREITEEKSRAQQPSA